MSGDSPQLLLSTPPHFLPPTSFSRSWLVAFKLTISFIFIIFAHRTRNIQSWLEKMKLSFFFQVSFVMTSLIWGMFVRVIKEMMKCEIKPARMPCRNASPYYKILILYTQWNEMKWRRKLTAALYNQKNHWFVCCVVNMRSLMTRPPFKSSSSKIGGMTIPK